MLSFTKMSDPGRKTGYTEGNLALDMLRLRSQ